MEDLCHRYSIIMLRKGRSTLTSPQFQRLVQGLKEKGKTCTVVESCCGGIINSSILAVPGSSAVYVGGSVVYNTKRAKPLLFHDDDLHKSLLQSHLLEGESEADSYIRSKQHWTAQTAVAFCDQLGVDYAIAEGGASGPTFRPKGLDKGFSVIAIAGRNETSGKAEVLAQSTVRSTHANREKNMRLKQKSWLSRPFDQLMPIVRRICDSLPMPLPNWRPIPWVFPTIHSY
jgi:nicotinamide mononucleotide (NMN) deamidase PncC